MGGGAFHGKRVFELMGEFAQLTQPAGRRVSLQRVHRPPDAADDLLVARLFLQRERFVVQRLQQFLRGFVKQLSQFRAAIIGGIRHDYSLTSIRW